MEYRPQHNRKLKFSIPVSATYMYDHQQRRKIEKPLRSHGLGKMKNLRWGGDSQRSAGGMRDASGLSVCEKASRVQFCGSPELKIATPVSSGLVLWGQSTPHGSGTSRGADRSKRSVCFYGDCKVLFQNDSENNWVHPFEIIVACFPHSSSSESLRHSTRSAVSTVALVCG